MRRSLLVLVGLLVVVGCGSSDRDEERRIVFVEVTSSPSGLLMHVSVGGLSETVEFEAQTPIARNVRVKFFCLTLALECREFATASVKNGDPAGKRVTMCLTDGGEHDCATSNDGTVSVTMTVPK